MQGVGSLTYKGYYLKITVRDKCQRKITSQQRRLSKLNITDNSLDTPFHPWEPAIG